LSREAKVESELYRLLKNVLEKRGYSTEGVRFEGVEPQYRVDDRRADLALILAEKRPLLIIETKRKLEMKGYYREERKIDPTSRVVIDQALWYAIRCGSPFFATTNGRTFALFTVPERGEGFSYEKHRILIKEIALTEAFTEELLSTVAKLHAKVPVTITPLDWAFIVRLRSFVNWFADMVAPLVKTKLKADVQFRKTYEKFSEEVGYKPDAEQLAKEMAYVFMNKIVFYKVLERYYKELGARKIRPVSAPDSKTYLNILYDFFKKAVEVTKDFEPVFFAGIYDDIVIPDDRFVLDEVNAFIEDMDRYRLEDLGSGVVGFIYEELLPAEERHRLGQFYTPPSVAELITKWAIRCPNDKVFDPGCGSGTFLVKAYGKLLELKGYKEPTANAHKEIISQLYANDINPFPLHLTALELASRYITAPSSEMNTILTDFFKVMPSEKATTSYTVTTPAGQIKREVLIPEFDAIIANPPYTRWVEISVKTRNSIVKVVGDKLKDYGLTGGIGNETGIYVHFIMYAHEFLKQSGRLGMIISNSWLQSDYGVNFAKFLLDHFQVKAVIDFNQRLFRIPLIGTCILLLEKDRNARGRERNQTAFIYVDKEAKVEEILDAIENPEGWKSRFLINFVKQSELPRNDKWIKTMFKTDEVEKIMLSSPFVTRISNALKPRYGNISGVSARGGTGADKFFYLTKKDVGKWSLSKDFLHALLISPRYSKFFTFTEKDWRSLANADKPCYIFVCHKPRTEVPQSVESFIKWGETTTLVRVKEGEEPKTANQSTASKAREKDKNFYGWYDLGAIAPTQVYTLRRAQYHHRFAMSLMHIAFDDSLITLAPKRKTGIAQNKLEAMLAYLNSDFSRFFVEIYGRPTGGGVIELDVNSIAKIPILNIDKLARKYVEKLSELFKKLEIETRKTSGAESPENLEIIQPIVDAINAIVAEVLGLEKDFVEYLRSLVRTLAERRISRIMEAKPEAIKGEEEPRIRPPEKARRTKKEDTSIPLDRFIR